MGAMTPSNAPRLSVLDQSPIRDGEEPARSIRETIALAVHCELLGFERFWVSEHHNSASVAGTAPEVLLGAIAARTTRIRIGSAGVMLPHYASLKVAECFRVLDAIAPGRIDIGLGRAPGSDQATALALNPRVGENAENFPRHVQEVQALLSGHALATPWGGGGIVAEPRGETTPDMWILGSSVGGAQIAAFLGLPYCFAYFFSDGEGAEEALALYRDRFRPSATLAEPHAALAVFAIAAETRDEALFLHGSREAWRLDRERGQYNPVVRPDTMAERRLTAVEAVRVDAMRQQAILGTGEEVARQLGVLAATLGAAEIAVVTSCFDPEARARSFTLLAEAAGLSGSGSATRSRQGAKQQPDETEHDESGQRDQSQAEQDDRERAKAGQGEEEARERARWQGAPDREQV